MVQEETYHRLVSINETSTKTHATSGTNAQRIGDFWYAAMDTATNARQGFAPLKDEFSRIEAVQKHDSLLVEIARLQYLGVDVMCATSINQDEKRSDRYAGAPLPGRTRACPTATTTSTPMIAPKMLRREYVNHVSRMFQLLGDDSVARRCQRAQVVMNLETELAGASRKLEALRDPIANYNAMPVSGVATLAPIRAVEGFSGSRAHPRGRHGDRRSARVLPAGGKVPARPRARRVEDLPALAPGPRLRRGGGRPLRRRRTSASTAPS